MSDSDLVRFGQRRATAKHCALWHEFRRDGEPSALILSSADATLFAAAPALVEALAGLMWRFENDDSDPHAPEETAPDILAARAALKLARGGA